METHAKTQHGNRQQSDLFHQDTRPDHYKNGNENQASIGSHIQHNPPKPGMRGLLDSKQLDIGKLKAEPFRYNLRLILCDSLV